MSADELVDIVDEDNNVIDTVTRKVMRENKLAHRASYIACCDRQGRFLIEVRTLCKDYAPGLFDACVGGVMQHGEDPLISAKRELFEELGIDADAPGFEFIPMDTLKIRWKDGVHFLYAYLYFARGDSLTVRQKSEVSGLMFLTEDELLKLRQSCTSDSVKAFLEILMRARDRNLL